MKEEIIRIKILREIFDKAFDYYWYDTKSLFEKIADDISNERNICLRFFLALNRKGMLIINKKKKELGI